MQIGLNAVQCSALFSTQHEGTGGPSHHPRVHMTPYQGSMMGMKASSP